VYTVQAVAAAAAAATTCTAQHWQRHQGFNTIILINWAQALILSTYNKVLGYSHSYKFVMQLIRLAWIFNLLYLIFPKRLYEALSQKLSATLVKVCWKFSDDAL
jgi:hypothetical protein